MSIERRVHVDTLQSVSEAQRITAAAYERSGVDFALAARDAIKFYRSRGERERRAAVAVRVSMECDAWQDALIEHLRGYYQPETFAALVGDPKSPQVDIASNPFKDITHELASLYLMPPVRTITDAKGKEDSGGAELYERLLGGARFQRFWLAVNIATQAFGDILLWPGVRVTKRGKEIVPRFCAGDSYSVIVDPDDPSHAIAIVLAQTPTRPGTKRYAYWTDEWHGIFEVDAEGKLRQVAPDGYVNPFGRMPFVHVHAEYTPSRYWSPTRGDDLVAATYSVGEQRTQLRYSRKMSSFKQGVLTGEDIESQSAQLRDEGAVIRVQGIGVTFTSVDWQIDFEQRHAGIQFDLLSVGASRGINPERLKRTANYQSAAAAAGGDRGLIERRQRQAPIGQESESEFYAACVLVGQTTGIEGWSRLGSDARLLVAYRELAYPADPQASLDLNQQEVALGIKSLVDLVRERDPSLTEDQALEEIRANIALQAELSAVKMAHAVPEDLTNRSSIDEANGRDGPAKRDAAPAGLPPDIGHRD